MSVINSLSDIVDNGLCIGCGLCQSVAGNDKIKISMSSKGRLEPKEISKLQSDTFEKIKKRKDSILNDSLRRKKTVPKDKGILTEKMKFSRDFIKKTRTMKKTSK